MSRRRKLLILLTIICLVLSVRELLHTNEGTSKITGSVGGGTIENAWLLPWSGDNFRYYSPVSYFLLDRGYVHDKVYASVVGAYKQLETVTPGQKYRIMEAARKSGGRMWPHRTHQVGMSVDFMVPKKKNGQQHRWLDRLGAWHYALSFDKSGNWSDNVSIDFETMAKHILALDDAARKNGLMIQKVILKINLKDDFFATESGRKVKSRGIYFARSLPKTVDDLHDDHYHVDFAFR
ncbi:MAG: penicillin-insensitive murein endopeptidase [Neolewinella sp.]|jgi:penicillin-insensitive murein endopeptidase